MPRTLVSLNTPPLCYILRQPKDSNTKKSMHIIYCQKMIFPNDSAHAIHTGLTAAAFADAGAHVHLFPGAPFSSSSPVMEAFFSQLGLAGLPKTLCLDTIRTTHKGLYGLLFRYTLLRQLRRNRPLCWASSVKEAAMGLTLRPAQSPPPVVFEAHHLISRLKKGAEAEQLYALEKKVFEAADMVVFNCEALRRAAEGYLPQPRRSLVSPIGYNERVIRAARLPGLSEPSEENGTVNLAYVGSLQPGKGVENLITALPLLPEHYTLTLIGSGKKERVEALRRLVSETGTAARVTFTGRVEQCALTSLLADCDIFVIPTDTEDDFFAPIKMYEALGFGMPIVATPTASLKDGLTEGSNALFAGSARPEALAAAIAELGGSPSLRQRMRKNNLEAATRLTSAFRARSLIDTFRKEFHLS